jgi:hypothetical protein
MVRNCRSKGETGGMPAERGPSHPIFFDVDAPITERGGEIYEYAGDA